MEDWVQITTLHEAGYSVSLIEANITPTELPPMRTVVVGNTIQINRFVAWLQQTADYGLLLYRDILLSQQQIKDDILLNIARTVVIVIGDSWKDWLLSEAFMCPTYSGVLPDRLVSYATQFKGAIKIIVTDEPVSPAKADQLIKHYGIHSLITCNGTMSHLFWFDGSTISACPCPSPVFDDLFQLDVSRHIQKDKKEAEQQTKCPSILTDREREIAELVAQGLSNSGISDRLFISEGTVKIHMQHIFRKLNVVRRSQIYCALQKI